MNHQNQARLSRENVLESTESRAFKPRKRFGIIRIERVSAEKTFLNHHNQARLSQENVWNLQNQARLSRGNGQYHSNLKLRLQSTLVQG